jgi:choline dehydrogenase-like flavoprotein
MPYVQGRMVGGGSPINGAICWRLPEDVYSDWLAADPALGDAIPWTVLEACSTQVEQRLSVSPTDPAIAGVKNLLMAKGADALGLKHRPIRRNVSGCVGLGRCMQGCPAGNKQSVDRTFLQDALERGVTVISDARATRVVASSRRAEGVLAQTSGGGTVTVTARHAVVLAASAVQTPGLLLASGIKRGPVGRNFQGHPGVSLSGRFPDPVRMWEGATQGHEVIGMRHEGLKFEALGFGIDVLAARLGGAGSELAQKIEEIAHHVDWGVAVKAEARGRVRQIGGRTVVTYSPTRRDVRQFRRGLRVLGEMMLAAGADHVDPGVRGFNAEIRDISDLERLESDGPRSPAAFTCVITHMFGTARIGSDPRQSVIRPDFRHHDVDRLYVADSSVFPTATGVNPQISIMAIAQICARRAVGLGPESSAQP